METKQVPYPLLRSKGPALVEGAALTPLSELEKVDAPIDFSFCPCNQPGSGDHTCECVKGKRDYRTCPDYEFYCDTTPRCSECPHLLRRHNGNGCEICDCTVGEPSRTRVLRLLSSLRIWDIERPAKQRGFRSIRVLANYGRDASFDRSLERSRVELLGRATTGSRRDHPAGSGLESVAEHSANVQLMKPSPIR